MTTMNLWSLIFLLGGIVAVGYMVLLVFREGDIGWAVFFFCGCAGLTFLAYLVYSEPKFGDRRTTCVKELKRVTLEEKGVRYSRVDIFCTDKNKEEIYVRTETGGEWAEVVK